MFLNCVSLALRSIRRNLLRSFLTTLGVVIGVAAVITMVTLGRGATRSVSAQIAGMGSNLIMLIPGQRFGPGADGAAPFKMADVEALRSQLYDARYVAPMVSKSATTVYQNRNWSTVAIGSNAEYFPAGNWELAAGRVFIESEERSGRSVCVIGDTVRQKLFGGAAAAVVVGSELRIKGFSCEIVGVLRPKGQSAMGSDQDDTVILPIKTVQRRIAGNQDVGRITVTAKDSDAIDKVKERAAQVMRERRNIGGSEDDDFRVMDTRQITEALTGTTKILTMLLGAVAAVSLLVGGIGIMNIMLVSVTERTREIGVRLAIGALEGEVLLQFLVEAITLSALGGVTGIILAAGASFGLSAAMGLEFRFEPGINVIAFLFAAGIGIVFGYFPARRAARLDPIEALRHE